MDRTADKTIEKIERRMRMQHSTAHCRNCQENRSRAFLNGSQICRNCSGKEKGNLIQHCPSCGATDVPSNKHHVALYRYATQFYVYICVNCHSIFTYRQVNVWSKDKSTLFYICQGFYDYLALTRRSYPWHVDALLAGRISMQTWREHVSVPIKAIRSLTLQFVRAGIQSIGFVPWNPWDM